jgi:hypothetical protein
VTKQGGGGGGFGTFAPRQVWKCDCEVEQTGFEMLQAWLELAIQPPAAVYPEHFADRARSENTVFLRPLSQLFNLTPMSHVAYCLLAPRDIRSSS